MYLSVLTPEVSQQVRARAGGEPSVARERAAGEREGEKEKKKEKGKRKGRGKRRKREREKRDRSADSAAATAAGCARTPVGRGARDKEE